VLGCLAAVGAALAAAYFLRMLRQVTHGRPSPAVVALSPPGLGAVELAAWAPLVVLALALGLIPALVTALSAGPVQALVELR
jgi:NADH-quinone oxidoreductase subunit M